MSEHVDFPKSPSYSGADMWDMDKPVLDSVQPTVMSTSMPRFERWLAEHEEIGPRERIANSLPIIELATEPPQQIPETDAPQPPVEAETGNIVTDPVRTSDEVPREILPMTERTAA